MIAQKGIIKQTLSAGACASFASDKATIDEASFFQPKVLMQAHSRSSKRVHTYPMNLFKRYSLIGLSIMAVIFLHIILFLNDQKLNTILLRVDWKSAWFVWLYLIVGLCVYWLLKAKYLSNKASELENSYTESPYEGEVILSRRARQITVGPNFKVVFLSLVIVVILSLIINTSLSIQNDLSEMSKTVLTITTKVLAIGFGAILGLLGGKVLP